MTKLIIATRTVLSKYATFSGRASREEYWWYVLAMLIVMVIARLIDGLLYAPMVGTGAFDDAAGQPLSFLLSLALLLPGLAVSARRLHDLGRTGWWLLIGLVPVIGALVLLYFYVQKGDPGSNRYGEPTKLPAG